MATVIIYSNVLCSGGSRVLSICSSVAQSWKRELTWPGISMGGRHGMYLPAGSHLTPLQPKCCILAKQIWFPMGHAGSHFSRRGKSSLMQSQDAKLCSTGIVIIAHMSQHMALAGGWGIWPPSLRRQSRAHPAPGPHLHGKEHIREVVSWFFCTTPNPGRYCAA